MNKNVVRCFLSGVLLLVAVEVSGEGGVRLTPRARISVLTCSPGAELYSLFGHTAIRVCDSAADMDIVFNYGTFDFRTPHFYLKYAKGLLPYQLSVASFRDFMAAYVYDNRSVRMQTLNLDAAQRQRLLDLLLENYRPENRTYRYNFLFDNCSTRIRDIIEKSVAVPIEWQSTGEGEDFWTLLDGYLDRMPWVRWGIHTILGQSGMREATAAETLFLPEKVELWLREATYGARKLAEEPEVLFEGEDQVPASPWIFSPAFVILVGGVLVWLGVRKIRSRRGFFAVASLFFLASGLIGMLLVFLSYFTLHPMTSPNFNLLWANPLNVVVALSLLYGRLPRVVRFQLSVYRVVLIISVPLWLFLSPAVPMASFPLLLFFIFLSHAVVSRME